MNFFKKKTTAFITLENPDFMAETPKLWSDLLYALEGHKVKQVTIRLYDTGDLSMRVISVIVSLALKLKREEVVLELEASTALLEALRRLNMAHVFSGLVEVA